MPTFDHDKLEQQYDAAIHRANPAANATAPSLVGSITHLGREYPYDDEPGPFALEAVRQAERKRLLEQAQPQTAPTSNPNSPLAGRITHLRDPTPTETAIEGLRWTERRRVLEQEFDRTPQRDPRYAYIERVRAIRDRLKDAGAPRQDPVVAAVHAILDLMEQYP